MPKQEMQETWVDPWSGRSPGEGNDNSLLYSCLENSMDREAWWATFWRVTKSETGLSDWQTAVFIYNFICFICTALYFDFCVCSGLLTTEGLVSIRHHPGVTISSFPHTPLTLVFTILFSVPMCLIWFVCSFSLLLYFSYEWNHTVLNFSHLIYFTSCNIQNVFPYCSKW